MIKIKSLEQELFGTIAFFGKIEDSINDEYLVLSISSNPANVIANYGGNLSPQICNDVPFLYNFFIAAEKDFLEFSDQYIKEGFELIDVGPHRFSALQQKINERGLKHIQDVSTKVRNLLDKMPQRKEINC